MGDHWNPLGDLEDAVTDTYDTFVDPIVDEVEDAVDTGLTLLEEVQDVLSDVVGDALESSGLDPDLLTSDWDNLTNDQLQALLDFFASVGEFTAQATSLQSLIVQAQSTYNLPLQEKLSTPVLSIFVALKDAIQLVLSAVRAVMHGLQKLIDLLPGYGIEEVVTSLDPRVSDWLEGKGLPVM